MLSYISEQPWCKRLRRKMLNTSDGHVLYRQFGFKELATQLLSWKITSQIFI